jgi:hypothetical protein
MKLLWKYPYRTFSREDSPMMSLRRREASPVRAEMSALRRDEPVDEDEEDNKREVAAASIITSSQRLERRFTGALCVISLLCLSTIVVTSLLLSVLTDLREQLFVVNRNQSIYVPVYKPFPDLDLKLYAEIDSSQLHFPADTKSSNVWFVSTVTALHLDKGTLHCASYCEKLRHYLFRCVNFSVSFGESHASKVDFVCSWC